MKKGKPCTFMPIFISEKAADSGTYFNIDGCSAVVGMDKLQALRAHEQTRLFVTKQFFVDFAGKLNNFTKKELYSYFHKISENANRYYLLNGFRYENDTAFFCGCLQFFFVEYLKFLNENYDDEFDWDTLNYWYFRAEPVFVKMVTGTDDENVSGTFELPEVNSKRLSDAEVESFFAEVYRLHLDDAFEAESNYNKAIKSIGFLREGNVCINHKIYAKKFNIDAIRLKNSMDYIKENDTAFNGLIDNKGKKGHYGTKFRGDGYNTLVVQHTITKFKTMVARDDTKNKPSNRILPLNEQAKSYLIKLRTKQEEEKQQLGRAYQDTEYVCRWPDGRAMRCDYLSRGFKRLLLKLGLPEKIRLHDLRHSCASYMLKLGCSMKEIADWLGHADIGITMNVYAHLDFESKQNVAERFSSILTI